MNKRQALVKAFWISIRIKGPVSMAVSVLGFGAALVPVLVANYLRVLTDELHGLMGTGGTAAAALMVFAVLVGLYIAQLLMTHIQQLTNGFDELKIKRYLEQTMVRHKCEVRYKYIENYDDFQKRITISDEYAGPAMARCIGSMMTILQLIVAFVGASAALWTISPFIVVVLYATSIPAAALSYKQQDETINNRVLWIPERALASHYGGILLLTDVLQEVRHYALFDYIKARWRTIADEYIGMKNTLMAKHAKHNTAADFLRSAVYIGILLITAWQIYRNPAVGLGAFTLVFALSAQLQSVTGDAFVSVMILAQNVPYMQEFFYLDTLEREKTDSNDAEIQTGEIGFDNVSFFYPNTDVDVLKNINVHIKDGEKIAVIGENGSGKSTFISLLCGMFDPKDGHINIGGFPLSENPTSAREAISVVFQDFACYETSLRENITVSDKERNLSNDEIMELLKKINVNDVIDEQPNGLDELVGSFSEKANNLSGGQWQKISIARAAYRNNAKIMILDEPTSALDPVAEAQLYRNFTDLTGDKTTILISHRLGITAIVDRILVFKDGRIIEDGSHKELMTQNGHYAEMYRSQAQWYQ